MIDLGRSYHRRLDIVWNVLAFYAGPLRTMRVFLPIRYPSIVRFLLRLRKPHRDHRHLSRPFSLCDGFDLVTSKRATLFLLGSADADFRLSISFDHMGHGGQFGCKSECFVVIDGNTDRERFALVG